MDYVFFKICLFRCHWVNLQSTKVDKYGLATVDLSKVGFKDDPFILANQAHQVFIWKTSRIRIFILPCTVKERLSELTMNLMNHAIYATIIMKGKCSTRKWHRAKRKRNASKGVDGA